jgi:hypothetical protein
MLAIPAAVAGVGRRVAVTPPSRSGEPHPAMIFAAAEAGHRVADAVTSAGDKLGEVMTATGVKLGAQNDPGGVEQCDTRNYSYPWQDNFCEQRAGSVQGNLSCPGNSGHQGVDIRGRLCRTNDPANQVVAVTNGKIIAIEPHYTKILSEDESTYFNFMHMHFASRPHTKAQLSASPGGIAVSRGAVLGNIGNIQQGTADGTITVPTTRHLHFEIRMPIVNPSTGNLENVPLPPYASLVEAYQRLQAGTP